MTIPGGSFTVYDERGLPHSLIRIRGVDPERELQLYKRHPDRKASIQSVLLGMAGHDTGDRDLI